MYHLLCHMADHRFREVAPLAEAVSDLPIITQIDEAFEALEQSVWLDRFHGCIERRIVDYKRIESMTFLERTRLIE